jgi:hypothetical protein
MPSRVEVATAAAPEPPVATMPTTAKLRAAREQQGRQCDGLPEVEAGGHRQCAEAEAVGPGRDADRQALAQELPATRARERGLVHGPGSVLGEVGRQSDLAGDRPVDVDDPVAVGTVG